MKSQTRIATIQEVPNHLISIAVPLSILVAIFVIMPIFLPTFLQRMMGKFLIFAVFSISYNIVAGYAGLLSLGQAAYFGVGGYTVAVLMYHFGINSLWVTAPAGIIMGTLTAAVVGPIVLRVTGLYFLILTFAIGQLFYSIAWNVSWLNVPGMQGIAGLPRPNLGIAGFEWTELSFYFFVLIIFAIAMYFQRRLTQSPFGHSLEGIREGEKRMLALGYNVWLHKYLAFVVGGAFAGLAGVLFVYQNRFIEPAHLNIMTSFLPMAMVIIGGPGTLWGPVVGAAAIVFVEYFSSLLIPARWPLILGGLFVLAIMFARKGLAVYGANLWKQMEARVWKH
jgi:branched-chain amino acid transport system permease protein